MYKTIEQMKAREEELGFTNETMAKVVGVPLAQCRKYFRHGESAASGYGHSIDTCIDQGRGATFRVTGR